jgi:two-component system sensor kinase FixL
MTRQTNIPTVPSAPGIALLLVERGKIVLANQAAATLLGAASASVLHGRAIGDLLSPQRSAALAPLLLPNEATTLEGTTHVVSGFHRLDGTTVDCLAGVEALTWQDASVVMLTLRVVDEMHDERMTRQESESQLAAFVASAMDAIISIDAAFRIVLFNPAAEQMFGYHSADVMARPLDFLLPERFRAAHEVHIKQFGTTGETTRRMGIKSALKGLRANGQEFPLEASISKSQIAGQHRYTVVIRDVSARQQREEELRLAQDQITHMARLSTMGEIASGISHEINQPLTAIATYAQALERFMGGAAELERGEMIDIARQITQQSLRAGEIIRRLKAMIRNQVPKFELLRIGEVLTDVSALAEIDARLHQVQLKFHIEKPDVQVLGNAIQLQQVLINLIRNAIDAVAELPASRRTIELQQSCESDRTHVAVIDHGPGVSAAQAQDLFRAFFTTKSHGTGLGLPISRTIMNSHRGELTHRATPGGGATFVMSLPSAEAAT